MVGGTRPSLEREDRDQRAQSARCAEQVSGHGLRRRHRRRWPDRADDGAALVEVAEGG